MYGNNIPDTFKSAGNHQHKTQSQHVNAVLAVLPRRKRQIPAKTARQLPTIALMATDAVAEKKAETRRSTAA
jgi:hypothetical protein